MKPITAPCATCEERVIRVDGSTIPTCTMHKDGIPTAILYRDRECPHPNVQTSLDGSVRTQFERTTGSAPVDRYFYRPGGGDIGK